MGWEVKMEQTANIPVYLLTQLYFLYTEKFESEIRSTSDKLIFLLICYK